MVICFNCSHATKNKLDILVASGQYADYGEVISLAVANLAVLQDQLRTADSVVLEPRAKWVSGADAPPGRPDEPRPGNGRRDDAVLASLRVPKLFALPTVNGPRWEAESPRGPFKKGESVPLEKWIFGQYNRLLPVKVSCRALANLVVEQREGIGLETAGSRIVEDASELRLALKEHEDRYRIHRDEALSTAFPTSGARADKSRLRFVGQFVAGATKGGPPAGLPADLKLINYTDESRTRISLTPAGWQFALARNPVLEGEQQSPTQKLAREEQELLLAHIAATVPVEAFAYHAVLRALADGASAPRDLDAALAAHVSSTFRNEITPAFLSTQRSGVISRMSDLGLIVRVRNGVKVAYVATETGLEFSRAGVRGPTPSSLAVS